MDGYKVMFEDAARTLAAIDEALGLEDDGWGEPERTLDAIADLKAQAARYEALRRVNLTEFLELWRRNLAGENFDSMVDELVKAKNE